VAASCGRKVDYVAIENRGSSPANNVILTNSKGLSLPFGVITEKTLKSYSAYGTIEVSPDKKFTASWEDANGSSKSASAILPKGFSGRIRFIITENNTLEATNDND
jgi:hypothetical protein